MAVKQEAVPGKVQRHELPVHTLWQVRFILNIVYVVLGFSNLILSDKSIVQKVL